MKKVYIAYTVDHRVLAFSTGEQREQWLRGLEGCTMTWYKCDCGLDCGYTKYYPVKFPGGKNDSKN